MVVGMKDGSPFALRGVWENWRDPESGQWGAHVCRRAGPMESCRQPRDSHTAAARAMFPGILMLHLMQYEGKVVLASTY
jgi:hypothetical protein